MERFTSLLGAAREGSEAAWQELYDGLAPAVLGYLRANAPPDPEDVLSEVFLQVARDLARFEPAGRRGPRPVDCPRGDRYLERLFICQSSNSA